MAIKADFRYNNDKTDGYVDMGFGMATDSDEIATQALVFMLTCINMNWKVPIGYFLISGIGAEEKARLVQTALEYALKQRFTSLALHLMAPRLICL